MMRDAQQFLRQARYREAAELLEAGAREARRSSSSLVAASFYYGAGVSRLNLFQYRQALHDWLEGREFARRQNNRSSYAMLTAATMLVYGELRQPEAALAAAREVRRMLGASFAREPYYPNLMNNTGMVFYRTGDSDRALELLHAGTELAALQGQDEMVRIGWARIGVILRSQGRLEEAESALGNALRLRIVAKARDNCPLFAELGSLRHAQRRYADALHLFDEAILCGQSPANISPSHANFHRRAVTRMALGQYTEALEDFRTAVSLARGWRLEVPAVDSLQISVENNLQDLFRDFQHAAATLYRQTGDPRYLEALWEAMEENRAVSLRTHAAAKPGTLNLPDGYQPAVAALRAAEVRYLVDGEKPAELDRLRLQVDEMAMEAGLLNRNLGSGRLPTIAGMRSRLRQREALLSFSVGSQESYLLVLTPKEASVAVLPGEQALQQAIRQFRESVEQDRPNLEVEGEALYQTLFGRLGQRALAQELWTIVPDGPLFDLPFGALVVNHSPSGTIYLSEVHPIRISPGACLPSGGANRGTGGAFLGFGDPITNTADPRWKAQRTGVPWWRVDLRKPSIEAGMPRLPGSGREVQSCSRVWESGGQVQLLRGGLAPRQALLPALEAGPRVAHFATHLVAVPGAPDQAALLLGLNDSGAPDLLTSGEIARFPSAPRLVALSACQSGRGRSLPGTGLTGIARSWLLAGSEAVVASFWPTPDDSGQLFLAFYSHLRGEPLAEAPNALRRAQMEMLAGKGWRARPKYWAAYFLFAKN